MSRARIDGPRSIVAALEEGVHGEGASPRARSGAGESPAMAWGGSRRVQWSFCSARRPRRSRSRRRRGFSNGLDPRAREGRRAGKEPRALYTGRFVQSRRSWRSRRRRPRGESGYENGSVQGLGRGGDRGSRGRTRNDRDRSRCPPVGPGRSQQGSAEDAESPRKSRESGVVLEETTRQRASGLVTVRVH